MPKTTMTIDVWECFRCGHKWIGKNSSKPIKCPKCSSPYWAKPKKDEESDDGL